ncbi:zinc finger CCCH domain-containing 39-like [Olea europaea subsp. europaea]|uniref:Zinc finger CCCH domain-containing 39-like n=1 Tax=Olea europaea subsp. europaea TaxID=158383 RepID=A0A8S0UT91_OLEEU|nr:zinc finger CCCH domain-containing 39-like [Olea europaea subsp. europaea]
MSFPDPAQQPPLPPYPPHFAGGDVDGFWPQPSMSNEHDANFQFEHPPFMRPRNFESNPPDSATFAPMKSRDEFAKSSGAKGTSHIFYKTRICVKFMEGTCRNGEHCTFAHGIEDLREPPPNWQELVREKERGVGNFNDDQRMIHRMKICKKFYNGEECPYGEKCNFLHEQPMKFQTDMSREHRESVAISIGTTGPALGRRGDYDKQDYNKNVNVSSNTSQANTAFWKTKLCSKWEIGQCPFGERCHFAHGPSDLQVPGARVETELMMNSGSQIPAKPLPVPVINSAPASAVIGAPVNEDAKNKEISKWKLNRQINRIYADWWDDLSPPRNSPRKEEI